LSKSILNWEDTLSHYDDYEEFIVQSLERIQAGQPIYPANPELLVDMLITEQPIVSEDADLLRKVAEYVISIGPNEYSRFIVLMERINSDAIIKFQNKLRAAKEQLNIETKKHKKDVTRLTKEVERWKTNWELKS
jgi:hypothetical protein